MVELDKKQTEQVLWLILDMKAVIGDQWRTGNPLVRINRIGTMSVGYMDELTKLYQEIERLQYEEKRKEEQKEKEEE